VKNISFTIYNKLASENLRSVEFVFFSRQKSQCVVSTLTVISSRMYHPKKPVPALDDAKYIFSHMKIVRKGKE
jgi:hypothetical protein